MNIFWILVAVSVILVLGVIVAVLFYGLSLYVEHSNTPPLFIQVEQTSPTLDDLLDAMAVVETGAARSCRALGDSGDSYGPLQIGEPYYEDANMKYGRYHNVANIDYAKQVAMKYWARYAPAELKAKDFETLARIHNGGPRGHLKPETKPYWKKVKTELERNEP